MVFDFIHGLLEDILRKVMSFQKAKLVKIDTDGFDCIIIRGATHFLKEARPVIFFEYDPHLLQLQDDEGLSVFDVLRDLGYHGMLCYDNVGRFMISTVLDNRSILEEIHGYFSNRQGMLYADICVFHSDDADIFEAVRTSERHFFCTPPIQN